MFSIVNSFMGGFLMGFFDSINSKGNLGFLKKYIIGFAIKTYPLSFLVFISLKNPIH